MLIALDVEEQKEEAKKLKETVKRSSMLAVEKAVMPKVGGKRSGAIEDGDDEVIELSDDDEGAGVDEDEAALLKIEGPKGRGNRHPNNIKLLQNHQQ